MRPQAHWTIRRRIIVLTLVFCAGLSVYAVSHSPEMASAVLPQTAVLAGAVIGSYVFGATWEDISWKRDDPDSFGIPPMPPHDMEGP